VVSLAPLFFVQIVVKSLSLMI